MRRPTSLLPAMFTLAALLAGVSGFTFADEARPQVGLWLTAWWTKDDQFHHWANCTRMPTAGRYTEGDPAVIAPQPGPI